jgi:hypothetical protein
VKKIIIIVLLFLLTTITYFGYTYFFEDNSGKGALQVTSTPGATVYLNGKKIGNTPICKCQETDLLDSGEHTIRLVPLDDKIKPFEEKITINKSTLTAVDKKFSEGAQGESSIINLSSISNNKDTELLVLSLPSGANVFLDNNHVGITPLTLNESTASDHNLLITKGGYKEKTIGIKTVQGYKLTALISLGIIPIESSPSAEPTPTVNRVIILDTPTGFLRVRETNSIASLEIYRVNPGETYDIINQEEGWFEIKLDDGKTGWISGQYAEEL